MGPNQNPIQTPLAAAGPVAQPAVGPTPTTNPIRTPVSVTPQTMPAATPVVPTIPVTPVITQSIRPEESLESTATAPVFAMSGQVTPKSTDGITPSTPVTGGNQPPKRRLPDFLSRMLSRNRSLKYIAIAMGVVIVISLVAGLLFRSSPGTKNQKTVKLDQSITVQTLNNPTETLGINRNTVIGAKMSFTALGVARFQSVFNSPTAFEIQNASGGSYSATGGTVGPQTNVPTDTGAYLAVNYIIKF